MLLHNNVKHISDLVVWYSVTLQLNGVIWKADYHIYLSATRGYRFAPSVAVDFTSRNLLYYMSNMIAWCHRHTNDYNLVHGAIKCDNTLVL